MYKFYIHVITRAARTGTHHRPTQVVQLLNWEHLGEDNTNCCADPDFSIWLCWDHPQKTTQQGFLIQWARLYIFSICLWKILLWCHWCKNQVLQLWLVRDRFAERWVMVMLSLIFNQRCQLGGLLYRAWDGLLMLMLMLMLWLHSFPILLALRLLLTPLQSLIALQQKLRRNELIQADKRLPTCEQRSCSWT